MGQPLTGDRGGLKWEFGLQVAMISSLKQPACQCTSLTLFLLPQAQQRSVIANLAAQNWSADECTLSCTGTVRFLLTVCLALGSHTRF